MNIAVFCQIWPAALEQLRQDHRCTVAINPSPADRHRLIADVQAVVLRSPVSLDRATVEAAHQLQLVIRAGMGLDRIDQAALAERGIQLVTVPLSAQSVAELSLGLILSTCRRIPILHRSLQEGRWEKHGPYGRELCGKTLGLLGFGRIGIQTAVLGKAFGMTLLACDRSPEKPAKQLASAELGVRFVTLDELFTAADVVAIQVPLDESTRGLVDARLIRLMRSDAVLINVGRGQVVDEQALYDALHRRAIAGAALDVFATEPPGHSPLLDLDNFVGTPHVGAQTLEAQKKVGEDVVKIVKAYVNGDDIFKTGNTP